MSCCPSKQTLPAKITAGLSFQVGLCDPAHPAPDWEVKAYLRGQANLDLTAAAVGTNHEFSLDAATTAEWEAGTYWYVLRASKGAVVQQIETGVLEVLPDFAGLTAGFDGRSQAQIALEAIDAVIARRATMDQERYRINNRELYRTPIADLMKLRGYYVNLVKREKACQSGDCTFGRRINVRFG